jgi:hypothetical protein
MARDKAFIFLGGFRVLCRNSLYLSEIRRRGFKALLITSEEWRETTVQCMANRDHPASYLHEAAFISGEVAIEGNFTTGTVAQARVWAREYDVVGVYAVGEMMVEQAGIIADAFGLPSPGLRATRACRSKYLQRLYCPEWSPEILIYPPGDRSVPQGTHPGWPAVLKPAGRRSSSGVREIRNPIELEQYLTEYPPAEALLLEEYVVGQEYSVETLVQNGRVVFESVTRKETNETSSRSFVEMAHTVPAPADGELLLTANRAVLEKLGFADGVAHAEFRLTPARQVRLMEIAARTPGDGLLALYHLATGAPMEPEIIRIALGEPAEYPAPVRYARQVYLDHRPGVLGDVKVRWPGVAPTPAGQGQLWPEPEPGRPGDEAALRNVLVLKKPGTRLGELRESDDRAVTFLIDAPSVEELDALEERVRASIDISVDEEEQGM